MPAAVPVDPDNLGSGVAEVASRNTTPSALASSALNIESFRLLEWFLLDLYACPPTAVTASAGVPDIWETSVSIVAVAGPQLANTTPRQTAVLPQTNIYQPDLFTLDTFLYGHGQAVS